jgi:hypothetical protein
MQLSLSPLLGEELQVMIEKSFDYAPAIVEKAAALIRSTGQDR